MQIHHANVVLGDEEDVWNVLAGLNFKRHANPDLLSIRQETLGIDEAREISDWAIKKPFGEIKVAIITTAALTLEAQNALLKIFEEPPSGTYFFLVISSVGILLPTLMSRVAVLDKGRTSVVEEDLGAKFVNSTLPQRMKIVSKIAKDKNKEEAKALVASVLRRSRNNAEDLLKIEKYLATRSPSIKMLLEYLAIMVY